MDWKKRSKLNKMIETYVLHEIQWMAELRWMYSKLVAGWKRVESEAE